MSQYKGIVEKILLKITTSEELRVFMNQYGLMEDPVLKGELFWRCSNELESEEGRLIPMDLLCGSSPQPDTELLESESMEEDVICGPSPQPEILGSAEDNMLPQIGEGKGVEDPFKDDEVTDTQLVGAEKTAR